MNLNLRFYWSLFLRRLPVMMALLMICSGIGIITALKLPPTYSAEARLLVEGPQIPDRMVQSTVQTSTSEQLEVIQQQLLTRSNLIDLANDLRVFPNIREMSPDAVYERMQRATSIDTRSRGGPNFMDIRFRSDNPQVAANVVNQYVTLILEANNSFRLERTENTLAFFEQEVARLNSTLDAKSTEIVDFKSANAEALPDDLDYRQGRQTLLQERLSRLERDRSALLDQRASIVVVFEETGRLDGDDGVPLTRTQQRLAELNAALQEARVIYSENNPRVVMLRSQIAQLEKLQLEETNASFAPAEEKSPQEVLLDLRLSEVDQRIATLDEDIDITSKELEELRVSISATPNNAIALDALRREYAAIETQYRTAVENLNDAVLSERLEVTAQGQKITIVESAVVPRTPSGPDRPKIAAMGIASGLALAFGFFLLLEFLNSAIRRPAELQSRFGILPIASVPYIESPRAKLKRRALLVSALIAVVIAVPIALYLVDTRYMPLELLTNKIITRFGWG